MEDPEIIQIRQHQRIILTWVNLQLIERGMHISDLHKDIRDGIALINLLEILTGRSIKEYHKNPSSVQQKLQNCDLLIQFLNKLEVKSSAQPVDIFNGNMSILFGMLYVLVKRLKDKKIIREKKGKRVISIDLRAEQRNDQNKLSLSQLPQGPQTDRIFHEKSEAKKLHLSLSCTDLEEQILALDNREKLSAEDMMKYRKVSLNTQSQQVKSRQDKEIDDMINHFEGSTGKALPPQSLSDDSILLDDILQTAKRLKDMKITRAPAIQKSKNINLSDLNDDELEAFLNDGNFDVSNNFPPISLEFEDDRIRGNRGLNLDSSSNNNLLHSSDYDDYDLDNLTINVSNDLLDSDINLDDL